MHGRIIQVAPLTALLLLLAVFHLTTIRDGHGWGDDFAQYLHHARNIALGLPYSETGYIPNPYQPSLAPAAYPPLAPLLMAPVYHFAGLSFRAFKTEMVMFLLFALAIVWWFFRPRLGPGRSLLVVALIGFNPFVWEFKNTIGPDFLFLALTYLSLQLVHTLHRPGSWRAPMLGFSIFLACATRSLGVALLPAILMHEYWLHRRIPSRAAAALGLAALLILLQNFALPVENSYLAEFRATFTARTPLTNAWAYFKEASAIWNNAYSRGAAVALFLASLILAAIGWWKNRRHATALECFLAFYIAAVLCWPSMQGLRYLLPLFPAFFAYLALASPPRLLAVLTLLAAVSYAAGYSRQQYGPETSGILQPEFQQLCDFLAHNTSPQDRFIFRKPRALSLIAGRAAASYNDAASTDHMGEFIRNARLTHIVVANLASRDFQSDRSVLAPFVQRNRNTLAEIYSNPAFVVYKSIPISGGDAGPVAPPP